MPACASALQWAELGYTSGLGGQCGSASGRDG